MNTLNLTQINAAVDAAFATALATWNAHALDATQPALQHSAVQTIGDGVTLRTDVYTGPRGAGFAIFATLTIGKRTLTACKQHGPETGRERALTRDAVLAALEADYAATLSAGITVAGITLAAEANDQAKFSQLMTLLREAEEQCPDDGAKAAFRESATTIVDIRDAVHSMSVAGARALIVQYGTALNVMWTAFAQRREALMV